MWLDRQHNVVCYDTPLADKIAASVPGSKRLSNGYVCVPNNLYNLQLCRWHGLQVPSPMDEAYDWPGRYQPFLAQRTTSNFLVVHPRAFVLSDMGTGKTLAALWAADYVMLSHPGVRCLVVCPLSTMQRVWADAIFTHFLGRRTVVVLHGDARKRRELLAKPADFYVINFDGLGVLARELEARQDIRMAIVDECSAYRDRTTKRHKLARTLLAKKDYLWMMTGTPTPNGPLDAYGMAKLVNNCNGESYYSYQGRTMTKVSLYKWVPKSGSHAAAMQLLQPAVRFSIDQCVDLPEMTVQQREVELSSEQAAAYKEMKNELVLQAKAGPITAANEAVLRSKLIQISCGGVYGPAAGSGVRSVHWLDASPRLLALKEVIEQSNEKIIVFAPLRSVLGMLHRELSKQYSVVQVHGDTSPKERNEIFRSFEQNETPRIIVADPGTMAHGITLVAATTIVWFGPVDRTELYLQANKRIHRPGQTKACVVVQLVATAIEREIFRRLESNETLQGLLLKLVQEG
jgi:SNF2 family DNA or RNA helicase